MLQLREWLRGGKETIQEWERYKQKDVDNDIYYQYVIEVLKIILNAQFVSLTGRNMVYPRCRCFNIVDRVIVVHYSTYSQV